MEATAGAVDSVLICFIGQNFYPDSIDQTLMFPPSLQDWLPDGHLARFLIDVVSALNLSAICTSHQEKDGRGQASAVSVVIRGSTKRPPAMYYFAHAVDC